MGCSHMSTIIPHHYLLSPDLQLYVLSCTQSCWSHPAPLLLLASLLLSEDGESPTSNVIFKMKQNLCTSRPKILIVFGRWEKFFFFFFFTPLGWVWQFRGCWAADRTLSAAVDGARTLPWPDPIIWVGSGKVESHCPSTMNQEYLHWASRSGNLMATTSHGH